MEMEVDSGNNLNSKGDLFVCCITKKNGLKRTKIQVPDISSLTLERLRSSISQELESWEWTDAGDKPQTFDVLHRSRALLTDEDVKKVQPFTVLTVIKKENAGAAAAANEENHKSEKFAKEYAEKRMLTEQLRTCSLALRTAFLNPKFVTTIEDLGDSEMLANIFAVVPELQYDPVAIGIIQDPTLIFHLSDPESLKKLAACKPWVIEAFKFITDSIHREKGNAPPQGIPSHLFNAAMFDGDDEAMDEDDDEGGPSPRGSGSRITREQLAAALSALGGGPAAAGGLPSASPFGGLFQNPSAQPQQPAGAPSSSNTSAVSAAGANIQNLMNTLTGAGGGMPGQPISSDLVARAMTDALRRLTPEQRADQLSAIRNFATQLQQQSASSAATNPGLPPTAPLSSVAQPPTPQTTAGGSSSLSQRYESQLRQMRDLGITDERLSILALRVCEGDVNTAAELVLSGWQGEGADPMDD